LIAPAAGAASAVCAAGSAAGAELEADEDPPHAVMAAAMQIVIATAMLVLKIFFMFKVLPCVYLAIFRQCSNYRFFKKNMQGFSVIQLPRGIAPFLSTNENKCLQNTCLA
jgi:hypothetical protein